MTPPHGTLILTCWVCLIKIHLNLLGGVISTVQNGWTCKIRKTLKVKTYEYINTLQVQSTSTLRIRLRVVTFTKKRIWNIRWPLTSTLSLGWRCDMWRRLTEYLLILTYCFDWVQLHLGRLELLLGLGTRPDSNRGNLTGSDQEVTKEVTSDDRLILGFFAFSLSS